jgi:hypothetical protein
MWLTGADVFWLREHREPSQDQPNFHLEYANLLEAHLEGAFLWGVNLEHADLSKAHLEGANLSVAHLEGANLYNAHLERADLGAAHLERANLRNAWMNKATLLNDAALDRAALDQLSFDGANLAVVKWETVKMLGDEVSARIPISVLGQLKMRKTRLDDYEAAVRANLQLAAVMRNQGIRDHADRFAYRAQVLQRGVLRYRLRFGAALGSWFLDLISGYGYRPTRGFITYVLVILGFAAGYFTLGGANGQSLTWNEAIVISMTAFHGRGFFSAVFQPGDLQAAVAAMEAFIGLLIEIVLIATFTQRFFAR